MLSPTADFGTPSSDGTIKSRETSPECPSPPSAAVKMYVLKKMVDPRKDPLDVSDKSVSNLSGINGSSVRAAGITYGSPPWTPSPDTVHYKNPLADRSKAGHAPSTTTTTPRGLPSAFAAESGVEGGTSVTADYGPGQASRVAAAGTADAPGPDVVHLSTAGHLRHVLHVVVQLLKPSAKEDANVGSDRPTSLPHGTSLSSMPPEPEGSRERAGRVGGGGAASASMSNMFRSNPLHKRHPYRVQPSYTSTPTAAIGGGEDAGNAVATRAPFGQNMPAPPDPTGGYDTEEDTASETNSPVAIARPVVEAGDDVERGGVSILPPDAVGGGGGGAKVTSLGKGAIPTARVADAGVGAAEVPDMILPCAPDDDEKVMSKKMRDAEKRLLLL